MTPPIILSSLIVMILFLGLSFVETFGDSEEITTLEYIDRVEDLLEEVRMTYQSDDTSMAFDLATKAYLDNYEYVEDPLSEVNPNLMIKIELAMREDLRDLIKNNASVSEVEDQIGTILEDLKIAKNILSDQQNPMLTYVNNIRDLLEKSKSQYSAGNIEEAKRLAMEAYIDNYEYLEDPVEEQDEDLNDELEIMLREELQALMRNNAPSSQVDDKIDQILERIDLVAVIVPEFGSFAYLVLAISVVSLTLFSIKTGRLRGFAFQS